jgi:hypothetical protein
MFPKDSAFKQMQDLIERHNAMDQGAAIRQPMAQTPEENQRLSNARQPTVMVEVRTLEEWIHSLDGITKWATEDGDAAGLDRIERLADEIRSHLPG